MISGTLNVNFSISTFVFSRNGFLGGCYSFLKILYWYMVVVAAVLAFTSQMTLQSSRDPAAASAAARP